jgi:hypothetical protein
MAVPRDYTPVIGSGLGWERGQGVTFDRTVRRWCASDIDCPNHGCALAGAECDPDSPRRPYCDARMRRLSELHDELEPELIEHVPKFGVAASFNDRPKRGRQPKLNSADRAKIRSLYRATVDLPLRHPDRWTAPSLAQKFDVSEALISRVLHEED